MIEFDALSSRLTVADVAVVSAPPMRKKTSWIVSGSVADPAAGSGVPTESRTGELTGPGVEDQAGDLHPGVRRHHHGRDAVLRDQGGEAQAEHDRVRDG